MPEGECEYIRQSTSACALYVILPALKNLPKPERKCSAGLLVTGVDYDSGRLF